MISYIIVPLGKTIGMGIGYFVLAIFSVLLVCVSAFAFLLFCSTIRTNANYNLLCKESCQKALKESTDDKNRNTDLSFIKYSTELAIGVIKISPKLVELLDFYERKLKIYERRGVSIYSKIDIRERIYDPEEMPLMNGKCWNIWKSYFNTNSCNYIIFQFILKN